MIYRCSKVQDHLTLEFMVDQHALICALKELANKLDRTPTRDEFRKSGKGLESALKRHYESYNQLVEAAELRSLAKTRGTVTPVDPQVKALKEYSKLCSKKEQIQGFFRHTLDLDQLFKKAGNPDVLTLVAQPDTHAKHKDEAAWRAFCQFNADNQPNVHMILGDFADCEGASHWPSSSLEPKRLIPEMKEARSMLEEFVRLTPKTSTRIFLEGNHENWIEQALVRMPEIFDGLSDLGIEVSVKTLLALEKYGYDLFPMNHLVQVGKAHFTHGIFHGNGHARKHLSVFKANVYYGHLHDTEEANGTSIDGPIEAASLGCLCRLDAPFLRGKPNNWVHAFGLFKFFKDGTYCFYKVRIINGRIAYNGKIYDGNIKAKKAK